MPQQYVFAWDLYISVSPAGGGTVTRTVEGVEINCPPDCTGSFAPYTTVELEASPEPDYQFSAWSGDANGSNPTVSVYGDWTDLYITANFIRITPTPTLTVSVVPEAGGSVLGSGIRCPRRCDYTYSSPTTVSLEAIPAPCYQFSHWSAAGLESSDNPFSLMIDADKQVTAHFERMATLFLSDPMASPDKIPADGSTATTLTVKITHEGEPPSVSIDLSPLGRSSAQQMYDDGTNGDAFAGDDIYSIRTTSRASTPIAMKALKVTATDSCNSVIAVIKIFVTSLIRDTVQAQGTNSHIVSNTIAGQTLNINHQLVQSSGCQIMQNGDITITVKDPAGQVIATETMSANENTITVSNAEAGNWTYEVTNNSISASFLGRVIQQNTQASYQIETVTGGLGIIAGTVTNAVTGTNLTGVRISTDTGGVSITVDGNYVMVGAAGVFTVTAFSLGYETLSKGNVTVNSGGTVTVDLALMPVEIPFNVSGVRTNLITPPQVGSDVQITILLTRSQSNPHYQWLWNTVPFTVWRTLADWELFNDSVTCSPPTENRYVVLAHAAEAGETNDFHQGGFLLETQGNSARPIQIREFTTDLDYPQHTGTPITLNATAGGGSGQIYFKFFYRLNLGGWTAVGDWTEDGQDTWTPQQVGFYTIVVHISEDNTVVNNPLSQAGMTFAIED